MPDIAAGFWCLYYSSVCLVYIWTTNCKQSQTRTTVFWIGERKKKDCFGKVPLILLMNVVILTSFFGIYEISVWWLLVWHFESICMYFSIFVSRASIVYDTDYRVFHKDWDGSRTMVLDSMGWGKLFLWHKPVKVIADWCKIGCLDELYFIFARCCMDIFCILVKSTLLFIPVSILLERVETLLILPYFVA